MKNICEIFFQNNFLFHKTAYLKKMKDMIVTKIVLLENVFTFIIYIEHLYFPIFYNNHFRFIIRKGTLKTFINFELPPLTPC